MTLEFRYKKCLLEITVGKAVRLEIVDTSLAFG